MIQTNEKQRLRLNNGIYIPTADHERFAQLEKAFKAYHQTKDIQKKVRKAKKSNKIKKSHPSDLYTQSVQQNIISEDEYNFVMNVNKMASEVIQVDDFPV